LDEETGSMVDVKEEPLSTALISDEHTEESLSEGEHDSHVTTTSRKRRRSSSQV